MLRVCLQKDPRLRAQAIGDVRLALEGAFETIASPTTTTAPSTAPGGRLVWMSAFAVALLAAAVLVIFAVQHLRESPPVQPSYRFQIPPPPNTRFTTFRLSPDGRYVAYIATGGQTGGAGQGGLWIHELNSLESRQIPGSEGFSYPFWSPDSTFIGFFQSGKLKKVAATGGPAQTICEVLDSRGGAWGPDGTILFTDGPARPIFRVPSSGGMPAQLTTLAGGDRGEGHRSPEFLPDGRHFLFHATANNADNPGIQLGSLDGGAPMRLLPDDSNSIFVPVAGAAGGGAEGGHVFFLRDGTLMALPFESHPAEGNRRGLPRRGRCGDCSQQPLWCLFSGGKRHSGVLGRGGGANNRELVWMDRSGKRLNALGKPNAFVSVNLLSLSPNGKTVAATVGTSQQSDIWLLDLASGSIGRFTFGFS